MSYNAYITLAFGQYSGPAPDWFAAACWVFLIGCVIVGIWRKMRR